MHSVAESRSCSAAPPNQKQTQNCETNAYYPKVMLNAAILQSRHHPPSADQATAGLVEAKIDHKFIKASVYPGNTERRVRKQLHGAAPSPPIEPITGLR